MIQTARPDGRPGTVAHRRGLGIASLMIACIAIVPAAAQGLSSPRRTLGIYDSWGAFRVARGVATGAAGATGGAVCYAIATPAATVGPRAGAFLTIATWRDAPRGLLRGTAGAPRYAARGQIYVRLSRQPGSPDALRLIVGSTTEPLRTRGVHGWTTGPAADARVRAALRAATSLSITGRGAGGRAIADTYRLSGAASALDAATLGCAT